MTNEKEHFELSQERKEAELVLEDMPFEPSGQVFNIVFLDDGHGISTPGKRTPLIPELGRSIKENEFNSAVVNLIAQKLKPLGIIPILVAPTTADTPLRARTDFANNTYKGYQSKYGKAFVKAVYVSVHYDAMSDVFSAAEGITVFVYEGQINNNSGKLAANIAEFLRQGTKQNWRGLKQQNFHVLRETHMPAVLTENGFMSSKWESLLMINEGFQAEVATEHAKGIAKYFNVSYRENAAAPTTPRKPDAVVGGVSAHKIAKGDTYTKLAERYNVTVDAIKESNPGVDPNTLQLGQVINIPTVSSPTKTPAAAPKKETPKPTYRSIDGIKIVGDIQIVNVQNAAYICDKPSANSKNIASIGLGNRLPIAGSVPGWWEVVYLGRRRYVSKKFGKML